MMKNRLRNTTLVGWAILLISCTSDAAWANSSPPSDAPDSTNAILNVPQEPRILTASDLLQQYDERILASSKDAGLLATARPASPAHPKVPTFDTLFVHLPDPIDFSSLDWAYDSMLFSVRKAFESSGFTSDRRWLPWIEDLRAMQGDVSKDPRHRHHHPGILLFRRSSTAQGPDLFVVFVIGEDPLTGVHRRAFQEALEQRDALLQLPTAQASQSLNIIGPVFSGSAPSLQRALLNVDAVRFISGSATYEEAAQVLTSSPQRQYLSMLHSDCQRIEILEQVLKELDLDLNEVAVLQEFTTPYGREAPAAAGTNRPSPCRFGNSANNPLVIPFPLSITSLREVVDQADQTRRPTWKPNSLRRPLPPTQRLGTFPIDGALPQAFSSLTPATVDLLLEEVVEVLIHEGIRAVVIIATDVRDTVFLGTELRSRLRGIQLFTISSNVLYVQPAYGDSLRGMVVVSTYPLIATGHSHQRGLSRQPLAFPNEQAEGVFNATVLALGDHQTKDASGRDAFSRLPFSFSLPASEDQYARLSTLGVSELPIWVTAVGARAHVPIRTYSSGGLTSSFHIRPTSVSRVALWGVFLLAVVILGVSTSREFQPGWWHKTVWLRAFGAWKECMRLRRVCKRFIRLYSGKERTFLARAQHYFGLTFCCRLIAYSRRRAFAMGPISAQAGHQKTRLFQFFHRSFETIYEGFFVAALVLLLLPHFAYLYLATYLGFIRAPFDWNHWALFVVLFFCLLAVVFGTVHFVRCGLHGIWGVMLAKTEASRITNSTASETQGGELKARYKEWWDQEILLQGALGLFISFFYTGAVVIYSVTIATGQVTTEPDLVLLRAVQIENGVTPLLLLSLIGVFLVIWTAWHRKRLERLTKDTPLGIAMHENKSVVELRKPSSERRRPVDNNDIIGFLAQQAITIRERLFYIVAPGNAWAHLALLSIATLWLWFSFGHSFESLVLPERLQIWFFEIPVKVMGWSAFDVVMRAGILVALFALGSTIYRFWSVSQELRNLLRKLASTPLLTAFERLPKRISRLARLPLFVQPGSWMVRATSEQNRQYLKRIAEGLTIAPAAAGGSPQRGPAAKHQKDNSWPVESEPMEYFRPKIIALDIPQRTQDHVLESNRRDADFEERCKVADCLKEVILLLGEMWREEPSMVEAQKIAKSLQEVAPQPSDVSSVGSQVQRWFLASPIGFWLRTAEEFVAIEAVGYMESVLKQLRQMFGFLLSIILIIGILIGSYPFEPQGLMRTLFIALIFIATAVFSYAMIVLNYDEVLNRLSRTDPRRLTWNSTLVFNIFLVLVVALLALVSTEYPTVWHLFIGWFQPLLETIIR